MTTPERNVRRPLLQPRFLTLIITGKNEERLKEAVTASQPPGVRPAAAGGIPRRRKRVNKSRQLTQSRKGAKQG